MSNDLKARTAYSIAMEEEELESSGTTLVYLKSDVDAVIAELKAKLESVQSSMYADLVDAGMENRKLKRELWLSRAKAYRYIAELISLCNPDFIRNRKMLTPNNQKQKRMNSLEWSRLMLKVSNKCLKKAEEYK